MPNAGPSKLTPELTQAICQCLRLGMPAKHACDKVGISEQTYIRWRKAGHRYDDVVYVNFLNAIKAAKSGFVEDNMQCIKNAASKSWQAAAWLLERREREYFAMKEVERLDELTAEVGRLKGQIQGRRNGREQKAQA